MKKLLASIMIVCYLALSCGIVINYHYCMGRLDSVKLFATKSNLCSSCGMHSGKVNGCCGDEVKIIRLQDDQNKAHASYSVQGIDAVAIIPSEFIIASFYNADGVLHSDDHSPPLLTGQDTYLQNCVFRI